MLQTIQQIFEDAIILQCVGQQVNAFVIYSKVTVYINAHKRNLKIYIIYHTSEVVMIRE